MKSVIYLLLLMLLPTFATAQNSTTFHYQLPTPLNLPDLYNGSLSLFVSGADNDTLGQNGQGVCKVYVSLKHEYIGDLSVTLTAPNGQSVSLVGRVGLFGATDFTTWNVAFTRCGEAAQPDPGKSAVWSNNQFWGLDQHYTGTYYPYTGCLDQLTGPVNGLWTLTIKDGLTIDVGMLTAFAIEFCDGTGMMGSNCMANAGALLQSDLIRCIGDNLDLSLPPTYSNLGPAPSAALYDYTYSISRASDGLLLGYDASANLTGRDTGTYTVCGVSYPEDADTLLPVPDDSLTIGQLRNRLNSGTPPFCGDVTSNCVNVIIKPEPADTVLYASVCYPDYVFFFGTFYTYSGTYIKTINQSGCSFTAKLVLTTSYPPQYNIRDTVCAGSCSDVPGFENACTTGIYTRTVPGVAPHLCDTFIRLHLLVLQPVAVITAPVTTLDCTTFSITLSSGSNYAGLKVWTNLSTGAAQNSSYYTVTQPGIYTLTNGIISGAVQCFVSDTIGIASEPDHIALTATGGILGCGDTVVQLQAQATGFSLSYNWAGPGGFTSTQKNPVVDGIGTYYVTVTNPQGCSGTAIATVVPEGPSFAITASADTVTCYHLATLSAIADVDNPVFNWSGPNWQSNLPTPQVSTPGLYTVTVSSPNTLCTVTATVNVVSIRKYPTIAAQVMQPSGGMFNGTIQLTATVAPGPFTFNWQKNGVNFSTNEDLSGLGPGYYVVTVTAANGCSRTYAYNLANMNGNDFNSNVSAWTVYPNPSSGHFTLRCNDAVPVSVNLKAYDGNGRVVWEQQVPEGLREAPIDLEHVSNGLYFLEIQEGSTRAWQKIMVQRE